MDAFIFNQRVKHGRLDFHPTVVYGFEDPDAAPYFAACGWGETTDAEVVVPIGIDELDIEPWVVFSGGAGSLWPVEKQRRLVMPERAAAHFGISIEQARNYVWSGDNSLLPKDELKGLANG